MDHSRWGGCIIVQGDLGFQGVFAEPTSSLHDGKDRLVWVAVQYANNAQTWRRDSLARTDIDGSPTGHIIRCAAWGQHVRILLWIGVAKDPHPALCVQGNALHDGMVGGKHFHVYAPGHANIAARCLVSVQVELPMATRDIGSTVA